MKTILCIALIAFLLSPSPNAFASNNHTDKASLSSGPASLLIDSSPQSWMQEGVEQGYFKKEAFSEKGQTKTRLKIEKVAPWNFYPQLWICVPKSLKKGTRLCLSLEARSSDNLFLDATLHHNASPWELIFTRSMVLSPEWQTYTAVFQLPADVAESWASLNLSLPRKLGAIEIGRVSLRVCADVETIADENRYANPYAGKVLPDSWWQAASARIKKIRKRNIVLTVQDDQKKPIANAVITISQLKHEFKFGTAVSAPHVLDAPNSDSRYRSKIVELFNAAVPENALQWGMQGRQDDTTPARICDWCQRQKLSIRGHCLVWPSYQYLPSSLQSLRGPLLKAAIKQHIENYVGAFRGQVDEWVVVNEALTENAFQDDLGSQILVDSFNWARKADPKAGLIYNDYDILNTRTGSNDGKRAAVKSLIRSLLDAQAPMTTVGIQSHMRLPVPRGDAIWAVLDEWSQFGLPIAITEFDFPVLDDRLQADYMREFLTAVFSHPAVHSFYMWGFWENAQAAAAEGGEIFRSDWTPRPAAKAYTDLLFRDWWTNDQVLADEHGSSSSISVFLGTYKISVRAPNSQRAVDYEVDVPPGEGSLKITLSESNAK